MYFWVKRGQFSKAARAGRIRSKPREQDRVAMGPLAALATDTSVRRQETGGISDIIWHTYDDRSRAPGGEGGR